MVLGFRNNHAQNHLAIFSTKGFRDNHFPPIYNHL